jgi:hypothetical protein
MLEEFKKNPHIKISPKSHCANIQSLGQFLKILFKFNRILPWLLASRPARPIRPNRLTWEGAGR